MLMPLRHILPLPHADLFDAAIIDITRFRYCRCAADITDYLMPLLSLSYAPIFR